MVPPNCGVTVAVKVTGCPTVDGFGDEINAVVVVALFTVSFTTFDWLVAKSLSPPKPAWIAMAPAGTLVVVKLQDPCVRKHVPRTVVPIFNVTASPSGGEPTLELTVAAKVTACP